MLYMTPNYFIFMTRLSLIMHLLDLYITHIALLCFIPGIIKSGEIITKDDDIYFHIEIMMVAVLTHQLWVPNDRISINQQKKMPIKDDGYESQFISTFYHHGSLLKQQLADSQRYGSVKALYVKLARLNTVFVTKTSTLMIILIFTIVVLCGDVWVVIHIATHKSPTQG